MDEAQAPAARRRNLAIFITVALSIWTAMHAYVFTRLHSVPWVETNVSAAAFWLVAVVVWLSYPLVRIFEAKLSHRVVVPLLWAASNWVGVIFLLLAAMFFADVVTLGGWLFPVQAPLVRGWLALTALVLSAIAMIQGARPPVVCDYEVSLAGLPKERDELVLLAISDLHLGTLIGERWLRQLIQRVEQMHPDAVLIVGDLVDGDVDKVRPLLPVLKGLRAPLGVWTVTGNHEFYADAEGSVAIFQDAGFKVLRDEWAELVPGLLVAGVDDLTARRQFGHTGDPLSDALANRSAGATVLLSHSPMQAHVAADAGVGLMLSGHTHHGQVWPFSYLVALRYPLLGGRYEIGKMTAIVSRGAGTWGPRMRLWRPSEIVRIKLRSSKED